MPWMRRVWRIGPLSLFRDESGHFYLRWARGAFRSLI